MSKPQNSAKTNAERKVRIIEHCKAMGVEVEFINSSVKMTIDGKIVKQQGFQMALKYLSRLRGALKKKGEQHMADMLNQARIMMEKVADLVDLMREKGSISSLHVKAGHAYLDAAEVALFDCEDDPKVKEYLEEVMLAKDLFIKLGEEN